MFRFLHWLTSIYRQEPQVFIFVLPVYAFLFSKCWQPLTSILWITKDHKFQLKTFLTVLLKKKVTYILDEWVNEQHIFIFGWTIPLIHNCKVATLSECPFTVVQSEVLWFKTTDSHEPPMNPPNDRLSIPEAPGWHSAPRARCSQHLKVEGSYIVYSAHKIPLR